MMQSRGGLQSNIGMIGRGMMRLRGTGLGGLRVRMHKFARAMYRCMGSSSGQELCVLFLYFSFRIFITIASGSQLLNMDVSAEIGDKI